MTSLALSRKTWWCLGGAVALLAALWTAGLGWWLPRWLKPQIEAQATQALHTPVTLAELSISPWTLTVRASGLRVGPAQAALLTVGHAEAQVSLQTLWRRAPVMRRITLTQPQVFIERLAAQRFNVSPLLDHLYAQPSAPGEPARFALYNIRVIDGHIRYLDHVLEPSAPQQHTISAIQIGLPFLSNLPSHLDVDVTPLLEASVNGSPLRIAGTSQPFDADHHSELSVQWRNVDLAFWANTVRPLLPPEWRIDLRTGQLNADLRILFEQRPAPAVPALKIGGQLSVSALDARWPQQGLAWRWASLALNGIDSQPLARQAAAHSVALAGLQIDASAPASPTSPATRPAPRSPPAAPANTAAPTAPWAWRVGQLDVGVERIRYSPTAATSPASSARSPAAAPRATQSRAAAAVAPTLGPITLTLSGLDASPQAPAAKLQLQVADSQHANVHLSGSVLPHARSASLDLRITQLQPAAWLALLAPQLPAQLRAGAIAAQGHLEATPERITLSEGQFAWEGLQAQAIARPVAGEPVDQLSAARLAASAMQGHVTLTAQGAQLSQLTLKQLSAEQLHLSATRTAQGQWLWLPEPISRDRAAPQTPAAARAASAPAITIDEVRCKACSVSLADHSTTPSGRYAATQTELRVAPVSTDLSQRSTFDLRGIGQRSGTFMLRGDVRPEPLALRSHVQLKNIDVRAFQPFVDPYVQATLSAAKLQAEGHMALDGESAGRVGASYKGRIALTDLRAQDRITDDEFVRWKSFALDGLDLAWRQGALRADLGQIALRDFDARLILNANGQLNLAQLLRKKGEADQSITTPNAPATPAAPADAASTEPTAATTAAPPATPAPALAPVASAPHPTTDTPPPDLRWGGIALSGGRINFTDTFIKPNYSARLTQIQGAISAVSSHQSAPAEIKLTGKVDNAAPLDISGLIHPLGARLSTDITASAQGIELTRLSPYAARYAGYPINKGSLSVTLNYKINQGQLEATNRIQLDQLTFGEKVDSPDATQLPVLFAVSLLKNSRGEIDVQLPVSGSIDDPQFSVGGIVVKIIVNLLTKAVSAPFSLLAGGGSEAAELGFVPFNPGSARLSEAATQRLNALAKALTERPALKLEIVGHADPAVDTEGLQKRHVLRLMRTAKAQATDTDPSEVTVDEAEHDRWLLAAYQAAKITKPRNAVGLPKTLPAAEMAQLLGASAAVDAEALTQLANRRSDAVKAHLAGKLDAQRILMGAPHIGPPGADSKEPPARVSFVLR